AHEHGWAKLPDAGSRWFVFTIRHHLHLHARTQESLRMNRRLTFFILLTVLLATLTTSAHDTWLLPKQGRVAPGTKVALNLTSGMAFPLLDTSIKPDRIDGAKCRLNGTT